MRHPEIILAAVLFVLPAGAQEELPPLRTGDPWLVADEVCVYTDAEGRQSTLRVRTSDEGVVRISGRGGAAGPQSTRASFARFDRTAPFSLIDGGETIIDAESARGWAWEMDPKTESWRTRHWRTGPGTPEGGTQELARAPIPEIQLAFALRAVAWGLGFRFTLPVLWAESTAEGPVRILRPTHVLCTGRETIDWADARKTCWRVRVEAQGRTAALRAVYWIDTEAPHRVVRHEASDKRIHELESCEVVPLDRTPPGVPEDTAGESSESDDSKTDHENDPDEENR